MWSKVVFPTLTTSRYRRLKDQVEYRIFIMGRNTLRRSGQLVPNPIN
jgi:hypothetical protein